jgi:hypothetical protein
MRLNRRDLKTVLYAISNAIISEDAYVDCYTKKIGKQPKEWATIVRRTRGGLRRMRGLQNRINAELNRRIG